MSVRASHDKNKIIITNKIDIKVYHTCELKQEAFLCIGGVLFWLWSRYNLLFWSLSDRIRNFVEKYWDLCASVRGRACEHQSTHFAASTYTIVLSRMSRFARSEKRSEDDSEEKRFRMISLVRWTKRAGKLFGKARIFNFQS